MEWITNVLSQIMPTAPTEEDYLISNPNEEYGYFPKNNDIYLNTVVCLEGSNWQGLAVPVFHNQAAQYTLVIAWISWLSEPFDLILVTLT